MADIRAKAYGERGRLPPRFVLMKRYNCSRSTIDKVVGELVKEKIVYARKGDGTFARAEGKQGIKPTVLIAVEKMSHIDCWTGASLWNELTEDLKKKSRLLVMTGDQIDAHASEALKGPSWLIWMTPTLYRYSTIQNLARGKFFQCLVNRRLEGVSSFSTDTRHGMDLLLQRHKRDESSKPISLFLPTVDSYRPYLAEREQYFFQALHEAGLRTCEVFRCSGSQPDILTRDCYQFLQKKHNTIFVPEVSHVEPLLMAAEARGLRAGRDFRLLLTDWHDRFKDVEGLTALRQNWVEMILSACQWAKNHETQIIQTLIKPEVIET